MTITISSERRRGLSLVTCSVSHSWGEAVKPKRQSDSVAHTHSTARSLGNNRGRMHCLLGGSCQSRYFCHEFCKGQLRKH